MEQKHQPSLAELQRAEEMMDNNQKQDSTERARRTYLYGEGSELLRGGSEKDIFDNYIAAVWHGRLIEGSKKEVEKRLEEFIRSHPDFLDKRMNEARAQLEKLRELHEKNEIDDNLHITAHHILSNEVGVLRNQKPNTWKH